MTRPGRTRVGGRYTAWQTALAGCVGYRTCCVDLPSSPGASRRRAERRGDALIARGGPGKGRHVHKSLERQAERRAKPAVLPQQVVAGNKRYTQRVGQETRLVLLPSPGVPGSSPDLTGRRSRRGQSRRSGSGAPSPVRTFPRRSALVRRVPSIAPRLFASVTRCCRVRSISGSAARARHRAIRRCGRDWNTSGRAADQVVYWRAVLLLYEQTKIRTD